MKFIWSIPILVAVAILNLISGIVTTDVNYQHYFFLAAFILINTSFLAGIAAKLDDKLR